MRITTLFLLFYFTTSNAQFFDHLEPVDENFLSENSVNNLKNINLLMEDFDKTYRPLLRFAVIESDSLNSEKALEISSYDPFGEYNMVTFRTYSKNDDTIIKNNKEIPVETAEIYVELFKEVVKNTKHNNKDYVIVKEDVDYAFPNKTYYFYEPISRRSGKTVFPTKGKGLSELIYLCEALIKYTRDIINLDDLEEILRNRKVLLTERITSEKKRIVYGKVVVDSTALYDVKIKIEGTNKVTTTNSFGEYEIEAKKNEVLIFNYPGMKSKNIIADKNEINIELEELKLSVDLPYFPNRNSQKNEAHKMTINISEDKIIKQSNDTILTNNNFKLNEDFDFLIGNWEEIEFHGNNGANDYINKIENGKIFSFEKDGFATLKMNNKKYEGKYVVSNLNKNYYKLQIITTDYKFYYLFAKLKDNKLTLTPVNSNYTFICKEGCASIFEKINK